MPRAILLTLGAVLLGANPRPANACSRWSISAPLIPETVAKSQVVAIGEFVDAEERSATFRIDEALKGPGAGTTVAVDNRTAYTAMACSPYEEPFREGFRFQAGQRKILMLDKQVDGLWPVGFFSDTAWDVPADELQPLVQDFWVPQTPLPTLAAVKQQITGSARALGSDLGFENRTPCNPTKELAARVAGSTAIVIGEISAGADRQTVRVKEVIAGVVSQDEFTLNHRVRRDYDHCGLVLDPPRPPGMLYTGAGTYLLLCAPMSLAWPTSGWRFGEARWSR